MPTIHDIARQVKQSADIVAVVGRMVVLKKAGRSYKGLCPFHEEKTPSFNVVPEKGIYHCFGCGAGGSVIDFVMKTERLEFMEALRKLAAELNIEIPDRTEPQDRGARDAAEKKSRALQSANEFALEWFRKALAQRRNPIANDYMEKRGITPALAEKFLIGASVDGWTALYDAASAHGFSDDLLVEVGLVVRNETGRLYDRFRHRLIFPILDTHARPIGFGGRRLDEDPKSPKYLNSAETPLYKKGKSLYALSAAADDITKSGYAILTEGYMDTIMAHAYGFTQAVASLGTALTPDQARLLKRFAGRAYFLYDGDDAGQNAMLRGGESLLAAGMDVRVISLPEDDDPDTYLQREGADALKAQFEGAHEYFDFALDAHARAADVRTLAGQADFVERVAPLINALKNEVAKESAIARTARRVGGLPREAIVRLLDRQQRDAQRGVAPPPPQAAPPPERGSSNNFTPARFEYDPIERGILKVMLESFEALEILRHELNEHWLTDRRLEPWILYFLHGHGDGQSLIAQGEADGELPGDVALVYALMAVDHPIPHPDHAARELAARLKRRHHKEIARTITTELPRSEARADLPEGAFRALHEEHQIAARTGLPKAPHTIE